MVDKDPYYVPSEESLEDEYIKFIEEHPRFPRKHMRAKFPNLDQMEGSQRVAKILADKALKDHHQSNETAQLKEKRRERFRDCQDRALSFVMEVLEDDNADPRLKMDASKFVLAGGQAYDKRKNEIAAERDGNNQIKDIPYPEVEQD